MIVLVTAVPSFCCCCGGPLFLDLRELCRGRARCAECGTTYRLVPESKLRKAVEKECPE